jgi:hypothetical protein
VQQGLALMLAWLDREGTLLKAYPFRPMALMHLLAWLLLLRDVEQHLSWERLRLYSWRRPLQIALLLLVMLNIGRRITTHTWPRMVNRDTADYRALLTFAREQTAADAWFAGVAYPLPMSFMRKTQRNVWVLPKVIPSEKAHILDWYQRMQARDTLLSQPAQALSTAQRWGIDYLVSPRPQPQWRAKLVFQNPSYWVYRLGG